MPIQTIDDPEPLYPIRVSSNSGIRAKRFAIVFPWIMIYFLFAFMFNIPVEALIILFSIVIFISLWQMRVIDFVSMDDPKYQNRLPYGYQQQQHAQHPPKKELDEETLALIIAKAMANQQQHGNSGHSSPPKNEYSEVPTGDSGNPYKR